MFAGSRSRDIISLCLLYFFVCYSDSCSAIYHSYAHHCYPLNQRKSRNSVLHMYTAIVRAHTVFCKQRKKSGKQGEFQEDEPVSILSPEIMPNLPEQLVKHFKSTAKQRKIIEPKNLVVSPDMTDTSF